MIKKFRKKPVVIEAEQFIPFEDDMGKLVSNVSKVYKNALSPTDWAIKTLEGEYHVTVNDWIITGVKGEKYPCKPDIFEKTYDEVLDDSND